MVPIEEVVNLSRLQFAATAMYHFLFVPLTLGLAWILVIMESVYVMTGREIYKDMTKFWGKLFGINFAMGVTTGITLEFQFGTNWSYYAHYVGDIFGTPLAIEGMMAFFLESTFVGLFFFGWARLSKVQHLGVTFLVALGSSLSALWILIANGWMNNPVGAEFNPETMRMELTSIAEVILNPVAQVKFVHTVAAGYVAASMFVLGVSSYYLLKARDTAFALRSFAIAAAFGLASTLSVIVLGDESGYTAGEVNKVKLAVIEAEWETEPAPAAITAFGLPNDQTEHTDYAVKIPYVLGLIGTRSTDKKITGIKDLKRTHEARIRSGMKAYAALARLKSGDKSAEAYAEFDRLKMDLGYGLLLKKYTNNVIDATEAQIKLAVNDTIPKVAPMFWGFRLMVGLGLLFLFIFSTAFYFLIRKRLAPQRWLLKLALFSIPLPWVAIETGWMVAEYGRQPWTISGVLPTHLSASTLQPSDLYFSLAGFIGFYTLLLVIELILMFKYARLGPSSLHTGRYHFEQSRPTSALAND
ncbi:cytochrome ubiquinol oxidase subunit I [Undibacterium sp. Jales W-56]|uniref:cytochrome ubiquinol oxidase subunit I n=1 Tax=Undibacterium sp. Jales W-56 TaxID=2897325 RepID=UPI0021CEE636|nr:cytochrome ubiquinol oxidase subunit I [Undibacterium sp. Jales W-56]MCU6433314.1 cytochrome ubiquinol oxidase subunit I [Undibacterium sp. Jales W-56]